MSRMEELPLLDNENSDVTEDHASATQVADERHPTNEAYERRNEDSKDFEYDVFISYSKNDRPWVKDLLLQTLEQEGKKVCIDYRDFQPGVPITDNVVHAIENSQVTVLVLTPAFVESEWCMYESKHALVSSLATSRARVLPLILVKCNIPNILKHLTYLDHTSEDVQPYFKEQLIDSLNNAEKWMPADHHGSEIVPISEVQQVVTRSLDQDKRRETAINKLAGAFSSFRLFKRRLLCCITCPCIIYVLAYFVFAVLFIIVMADQKVTITPLKPTSVNSTATNVFLSFKISNSVAEKCEILRILANDYSEKPLLADTFGFEDFRKTFLYYQKSTTQNVTSLSPKKMFKQEKFRIYGDMTVTTKFCFHSQNATNQNASLRLYKPTTTDEVNYFERSGDARHISQVKYTDYTSLGNKKFCSTYVIKGQTLTSKEFSAFVYKNVGKTPLFLNSTTIFKTPTCKTSSSFLKCRNSSECHIPSSPRTRYIIVSKKISAPIEYGADEIQVRCVYKLPVLVTAIIYIINLGLGILLVYLTFKVFNKKCRPRLQKWYFGREIVRDKLGETALQMIENSPELDELSKTIKNEREHKEFTI